MESSLDRGPTVPTEPEKVCEGLLYKSGSIAEECNDKAEASRSSEMLFSGGRSGRENLTSVLEGGL